MAFVPLFCHSHHSPHGVSAPADLIRRARALGYNTLGLCDEVSISGFHEFDVTCRQLGIRPVFGCRLYMDGLALTGHPFPVDFLIETEQGYRNLVRLLTRQHAAGVGERRPLKRDEIRDRAGGLLAVIPPDGELETLVLKRDRVRTERFLKSVVELFGAAVALGVDNVDDYDQAALPTICRLARFANLRVLATPAVFYPEPADAAAAAFLDNHGQAPARTYTPPENLKTLSALWPEDEILARWSGESEEIPHEAGAIARRCTWRPSRMRRVFPVMDLERGFDPNSYLFDQVIRGATMRYGEITESLKQRINREIDEIKQQNLASYLLLNHQLCQALDERGISRGMGRGRIVSSVVAYCLGITRIDPLHYSLVYKGLIGEGETYPAINVEAPSSGVKPLLAWLRETYGEEYMAEIGRIQETRREQMIGELAAWAGMTAEERRLTLREKSRRSAGAAQRLDEMAEGARSRRWRDPAFLGDVAARLTPRPKHWVSTGDRFVICAEPLECVVPLVASIQGRPVSGIEEAAIDTLGLARIVMAPHQLLDMLDQTMRAARAQDPSLEFQKIPLDDRATFELLARGDTGGIPPLEGVTMRCLLRKHAPGNLLQLLRIKTEAGLRTPEDRPRELSEELPDVLLSYQLAFLKANYAQAFYSAAIGAVINQHGNPAALVRAARREGFEVQPPDINLSDWETTIHAGGIRLGLAAVRNFGPKAWENVQAVRSGGNFTSIENFCERVNMRVVNLKALRALIAAGAMDGLEENRATMDAMVTQLQRRMRERQEEAGRTAVQGELFELEQWSEGGEPELGERPVLPEWNSWEKLQREYEALGFFLGIDSLLRYRIVLDHLKPLHIEPRLLKFVGRTVRLVGLTGTHEDEGPLISQPGSVLLDLEGLPVLLSPPLARIASYCLTPGVEVLATGRLVRDDGYACLHADGLWRLSDLEDQATKVTAISLRLDHENKATLKLLLALVRQYPGNTEIKLLDYPGRRGWTYSRLARQKVFFCSPLYQGLCKILPLEAIELFGQNGEALLIQGPHGPQEPAEGEEGGTD